MTLSQPVFVKLTDTLSKSADQCCHTKKLQIPMKLKSKIKLKLKMLNTKLNTFIHLKPAGQTEGQYFISIYDHRHLLAYPDLKAKLND